MKTISLSLMVFAVLLFAGCSSNDTPKTSDTKDSASAAKARAEQARSELDAKELSALNELATRLDIPSQHFSIPANKPSTVTGKKGTIIHVNPTDLVTASGAAPTGTIDIELKELTTRSEFLRANTPTVSNGKLLVSGGAYYINATSGGEQLQLKQGKTLKAQFPRISYDSTMRLFYGQRDSSGDMNWETADLVFLWKDEQISVTSARPIFDPRRLRNVVPNELSLRTLPADTSTTSRKDTAYIDYDSFDSPKTIKVAKERQRRAEERQKEEWLSKRYASVYNEIELERFGWINCDRFEDSGDMTVLTVQFNPADSIKHASINLLFKDINSMLQAHEPYYANDGKSIKFDFDSIPVGTKATLVAYSINGETIKANTVDLTMNKAQPPVTLPMQTTTEQKLKQMMDLK